MDSGRIARKSVKRKYSEVIGADKGVVLTKYYVQVPENQKIKLDSIEQKGFYMDKQLRGSMRKSYREAIKEQDQGSNQNTIDTDSMPYSPLTEPKPINEYWNSYSTSDDAFL